MPPRAGALGVIGCHACGLVCATSGASVGTSVSTSAGTSDGTSGGTSVSTSGSTVSASGNTTGSAAGKTSGSAIGDPAAPPCPRCGAALHRRRPNSIARGWAFLLAALILYVPANVLPVLHTRLLGDVQDSTIMRGVIEFWHDGSYGIAAIIFIASVAVPCTKFLVLGLLLWTSQRRSRWAMADRTRLYRLIELVGYWSMLDVLVVAIVTALVRFGALSESEPRIGIFFFGMVVIFTMLSAMSFDPRLIWDGDADD